MRVPSLLISYSGFAIVQQTLVDKQQFLSSIKNVVQELESG